MSIIIITGLMILIATAIYYIFTIAKKKSGSSRVQSYDSAQAYEPSCFYCLIKNLYYPNITLTGAVVARAL
jgi:hypothetical protein